MKVKVDTQLLKKVRKVTGIKSDKVMVENALQLFITLENQKGLLNLWGKIKFNEDSHE